MFQHEKKIATLINAIETLKKHTILLFYKIQIRTKNQKRRFNVRPAVKKVVNGENTIIN